MQMHLFLFMLIIVYVILNIMISKKKKNLKQSIFESQPSLQQSGLFSANAQKEHLLE